ESHARQHLNTRRDHIRRVVATAESRFDYGDLHAASGELVVGGRGQRLELSHVVTVGQRPVDEVRGARGTLDRGREGRGLEIALVDLDPLRERDQVWRGVRAGP